MNETNLSLNVRRATSTTAIGDVMGDITATGDTPLMAAYNTPGTKTVILNFSGLGYMNRSGIGLLVVTLLMRMNRQKQRLRVYGLTDHDRHLFVLTRLSLVNGVHSSEDKALSAA